MKLKVPNSVKLRVSLEDDVIRRATWELSYENIAELPTQYFGLDGNIFTVYKAEIENVSFNGSTGMKHYEITAKATKRVDRQHHAIMSIDD